MDYCSGHAVLRENEAVDRLASTTDFTTGLQLGKGEELRDAKADRPEHHSTDRVRETGVEGGSGRSSNLPCLKWPVLNQTNRGHVSRAIFG